VSPATVEQRQTKRERHTHISDVAAGKNCAADAAKYQNESSKKIPQAIFAREDVSFWECREYTPR